MRTEAEYRGGISLPFPLSQAIRIQEFSAPALGDPLDLRDRCQGIGVEGAVERLAASVGQSGGGWIAVDQRSPSPARTMRERAPGVPAGDALGSDEAAMPSIP